MASYVEEVLVADERILYQGNISAWSLSLYLFLGVVLLPAFGLGLILLAIAYVKYKSTELAVTNKRVIAKFGFVSRRTVEMTLSKVETIQVVQTVMGRIFNFGSLTISGAGIPQEPILGISSPMAFRKAFTEAHDAAVSR